MSEKRQNQKEKPFPCDCGKGFRTAFTLQRHQSSSCEFKGMSFFRPMKPIFVQIWFYLFQALLRRVASIVKVLKKTHQHHINWPKTNVSNLWCNSIYSLGLKYEYSAFCLPRVDLEKPYATQNFTATLSSSHRKSSRSSTEFESSCCRPQSNCSMSANNSQARSMVVGQVPEKKICYSHRNHDDRVESNTAGDTGKLFVF